MPSTKRPLEDPSSPSGPNDQPDPKRLALDKVVKGEEEQSTPKSERDSSVAITTDAKAEPTSEEPAKLENGAKDGHNDPYLSDAPNGTGPTGAAPETHPIQSTASHAEHVMLHPNSQHQHQDETGWIHIRAVISSAEAATCIGKGGENVSQIRRLSGAKCTVSDYSRGAVERILTVSGMQDAVAKVRHGPKYHIAISNINLIRHLG
jgi:heterogeneous nuclear rnp K-like protein 2